MPAAASALRARRTCGLPAMPTTRTGFVVAAAWTLWTMSALRLATLSRIAGWRRASSRIVRGMAGAPGSAGGDHTIAARLPLARPAGASADPARLREGPGRSSGGEHAVLEVADRLLQLARRVHDERAILGDRLTERPAGDQKHAGRSDQVGRGDQANAGGIVLVAEDGHALGVHPDRCTCVAEFDRARRHVGERVVPGRQLGVEDNAGRQREVEDDRL